MATDRVALAHRVFGGEQIAAQEKLRGELAVASAAKEALTAQLSGMQVGQRFRRYRLFTPALPLSYSGSPGVNGVSYMGILHGNRPRPPRSLSPRDSWMVSKPVPAPPSPSLLLHEAPARSLARSLARLDCELHGIASLALAGACLPGSALHPIKGYIRYSLVYGIVYLFMGAAGQSSQSSRRPKRRTAQRWRSYRWAPSSSTAVWKRATELPY